MDWETTPEMLRSESAERNDFVFGKVKSSEWEQDMWDKTEEDTLECYNGPIVDLDETLQEGTSTQGVWQ